MVQPKNAIEINYTSKKVHVIHSENFRYASDGAMKKAKEILKSESALFLYHADSNWYVSPDGCIGRFNRDGNLKLIAHPKKQGRT
mgnify:CR=1 FL=1